MSIAPLSKYNFYHSAGDGRDGFIKFVSDHQTDFTYVPKSPEMPGTRQPGMASNTVGITNKPSYTDKPYGVTGYTGLTPGYKGEPTPADAFPNLAGAGALSGSMARDFKGAMAQQDGRAAVPTYRLPGFAGLCPGHAQVCGYGFSPICVGEAGNTMLAAIGPEAPGLNAGEQVIKKTNLQPGAVVPAGLPRTKTGYTGHLPGKNFSSNFGKNFAYTSEELLACDGQPAAGGIGDPQTNYNADVGKTIKFPLGHVDRPPKLQVTIAGYSGFRPRTTPNYWRE